MSTRSRIGLATPNGAVYSIYCHFDGYPSGVGQTLLDHYQDEAKVRELIELGNISILAEQIGEQHSFDWKDEPQFRAAGQTYGRDYDKIDADPRSKMVLAYGRDRGETDVDATVHDTREAFYGYASEGWEEYLYLFDSGEWFVSGVGGGAGPMLVSARDPDGTLPADWRHLGDYLTADAAKKAVAAA